MKTRITVVSLGPGAKDLLTLRAARLLKESNPVIYRTVRHPLVEAWLAEGIACTSLDDFYDRFDDFDEMHAAMAKHLWCLAAKHPLVYAVMDAQTDRSVEALRQALPEHAELTMVPGISLSTYGMSMLPPAVQNGWMETTAAALNSAMLNPDLPLWIGELNTAAMAGNVKLMLSDLYPDDLPVTLFRFTDPKAVKMKTIPLFELDRQKHYDHTSSVFLTACPYASRSRYQLNDLVRIMDHLLSPQGCPWDRKQTHASLRPYLIEEAYEVAETIDQNAPELADELGDVLLQVVFHAAIAERHGEFALRDITTAICEKMIRRHPVEFGLSDQHTPWEELKKDEKGLRTHADVLSDVCRSLPALLRADKVQAKAARVGFDWSSASEALTKVREEADEVLQALNGQGQTAEELGDLLFSCVNVTRLAGFSAEELMNAATDKFIRRFTAMEQAITADEKSLNRLTLNEMDVYWSQVKASEPCGNSAADRGNGATGLVP